MKVQKMSKIRNFNIPIEEVVAKEFVKFCDKVTGMKRDKLTASLKAGQAIYQINKGLYFNLTNPEISIKDAREQIIQAIINAYWSGETRILSEKDKTPASEKNTEPASRSLVNQAIAYIKELSLAEQGYSARIKLLSKEDQDTLKKLRAILATTKKKPKRGKKTG